MKEAFDFLHKNRVFAVATVGGGKPRVRPFGAVRLVGEQLYFCTGKGKAVYQELIQNPWIEIMSYGDGEWLRLSGKVVFEPENEAVKAEMRANAPERAQQIRKMPRDEKEALLARFPGLRNMISLEEDALVVFRLEDAVANFYSTRDATHTITY
ncbi:MAG TPA: pyridoxamine 5'-phosphate oxidase family protein [Clostridia bacterium]|nr:pyridoxamine 5'-phosphate oxidase family protein [Clostridia bacterium]